MKPNDVPESLLDFLRLHHDGGDVWPDPQPLARDVIPVAPFRKGLLPKVLRNRVYDVAHRMQCPPDFVAVPLLVMIGSIIGTGCGIRPKQRDDWIEYPNLWGAVVARPGALKSPAISEALAPLRRLEWRAAQDHAAAKNGYLLKELSNELQLKQIKAGLGKAGGLPIPQSTLDQMAELSMKAPEPKPRRFRTQDATVEKLGELLSTTSRGLLVERDELAGWLASLEIENQLPARAFYLEGWNGKASYHTDRIGRGSISIQQLCLSVFGGIQPGRLQDYLYQANSSQNDGFLQRFQLTVCPDAVPTTRLIDQDADEPAGQAIDKIAERLAHCDFGAMGAGSEKRGEDVKHFFRFHHRAQPRFNDWYLELDRKVGSEDSPILAEHLAKFRKLVPALSLIFHLVDNVTFNREVPHVPRACLERAIRWADYLETHARRVYGLGTDLRVVAAERLAKEIQRGSLQDGFSERDVYRRNWHTLSDPELVRAACRELEQAGWIRRVPLEPGPGRPSSPSYTINPRLKN